MTALEKFLPWTVRYLNRFTLLRILAFLKSRGLVLLAFLIALWMIWGLAGKVMESACRLDLRSIEFSSNGIVAREYALGLLQIEEGVNLAALDTAGLESRLLASPAIASARVQKELPSTLRVEVEARVPVVRIAYEESPTYADAGQPVLFMDPGGFIFPFDEQLHADYRDIPVWRVTPSQVVPLRAGSQVRVSECAPIVELMRLINSRSIADIPPVLSISRPRGWQLLLFLANGTEAQMTIYNLAEQVGRLSLVLENARARRKHIRRANLIPRVNPVVEYDAVPDARDSLPDDAPVAEEVPED